MKQFNLAEYLKNPSRKVINGRGLNVRIICTDRKDSIYPIVALIETKLGKEFLQYYTKDGKYYIDALCEDDLFFAPEKHEGWVNIYRDSKIDELCCRYIFPSEEEAKRNAASDIIATAKIEWEE